MSVRDMFAIQRQQIFYTTQCSRGNVQRISRSFLWHQVSRQDMGGKSLGVSTHIDARYI